MTVRYREHSTPDLQSISGNISEITLYISGNADVAAFKNLVQRGSNLAPDLPASMKELADLVTNGRIMQTYQHEAVVQHPNNDRK